MVPYAVWRGLWSIKRDIYATSSLDGPHDSHRLSTPACEARTDDSDRACTPLVTVAKRAYRIIW